MAHLSKLRNQHWYNTINCTLSLGFTRISTNVLLFQDPGQNTASDIFTRKCLLDLLQSVTVSQSHDLDSMKGTAWLFCRLSLTGFVWCFLVTIWGDALSGRITQRWRTLPHYRIMGHMMSAGITSNVYSFIGLRWWRPLILLGRDNLYFLELLAK